MSAEMNGERGRGIKSKSKSKSKSKRMGGREVWLCLLFAVVILPCLPQSAVGADARAKPDQPFLYHNDVVTNVPWSIHIVRVKRNHSDFEFCTTSGGGKTIGMGDVSEQLKSLPPDAGQPLAAINGDFYEDNDDYLGRPRDIQIRFGEVLSTPSGHASFWIDPQGNPRMTNVHSAFRVVWPDGKITPVGLNEPRQQDTAVLYTSPNGESTRATGGTELVLEKGTGPDWLPLRVGKTYTARIRSVHDSGNTPITPDTMVLSLGPTLASRLPPLKAGGTAKLITQTIPDLSGVNVAIGGGPTLVRRGKVEEWHKLVKFRHPRSAIGWNSNHIFLVVVDGRQLGASVGMTFPELANYMLQLGCDEAMNFDGGGSATLWALGDVRSSPSEGQERPSPNALVILKKRNASREK